MSDATKIMMALDMLSACAPELARCLEGVTITPSDDCLSAFGTSPTGDLTCNTEMIETLSQDEVTFSLGVLAFMLANDARERSEGRDLLIWGMATNLAGQNALSKFLPIPDRVRRLRDRLETQYGFPPDLPLEDLYNAMIAHDGGKGTQLH